MDSIKIEMPRGKKWFWRFFIWTYDTAFGATLISSRFHKSEFYLFTNSEPSREKPKWKLYQLLLPDLFKVRLKGAIHLILNQFLGHSVDLLDLHLFLGQNYVFLKNLIGSERHVASINLKPFLKFQKKHLSVENHRFMLLYSP